MEGRDRDTSLYRQKWEYPCWEVEAERRQKRRAGVGIDVRGASARKPIRLGRPKGESRRSFESGEYSSCSSSDSHAACVAIARCLKDEDC